jgi:hypothetical protein
MRYHGKDGQVKIGAAVAASLNKWTLNAATDKADVTAFGDSNKQYVVGLKDVKGSLGGWFDDMDDALFTAADAGTPVDLELFPVDTLTGLSWKGPAYLDASIDVPANGGISISGDFVAAGNWTRTWPAVVAATGATAGTPGTYTPAGAQAPANITQMGSVVASPTTAWTTGQSVVTADAGHVHWSGTAWVAGNAP